MLTIRAALEADVAALWDMDHIARQDTGRRTLLHQAVGRGECVVATDGGEIAAYGVLEHSFFGSGFIALVYVRAERRRRGIGAAVVAHLERLCRTPKLFTSANLSNLPMQALLAGRGYALSGVLHNLDEGDPELIYLKRLGPPPSGTAPPARGDGGCHGGSVSLPPSGRALVGG